MMVDAREMGKRLWNSLLDEQCLVLQIQLDNKLWFVTLLHIVDTGVSVVVLCEWLLLLLKARASSRSRAAAAAAGLDNFCVEACFQDE